MKKIALIPAFLLLLAASALAQNHFRFGFQVGNTWSWMRTDDKKLEGLNSNWGFRFGGVGEYYFNESRNYGAFAGIGFGLNQGGKIQNGYPLGNFWNKSDLATPLQQLPMDAKLRYHINYVEIPFGLKMRGLAPEDSRLKFYIEFPIITISFKSKATGDIQGDNDLPNNLADEANDITIRNEVNGAMLSWGLSGGIEYELAGNSMLVAGLVWQQGFTDVTSDNGLVSNSLAAEPSIKEDSKATIRMLGLKIGIFF